MQRARLFVRYYRRTPQVQPQICKAKFQGRKATNSLDADEANTLYIWWVGLDHYSPNSLITLLLDVTVTESHAMQTIVCMAYAATILNYRWMPLSPN
jgi:hypothetical protein